MNQASHQELNPDGELHLIKKLGCSLYGREEFVYFIRDTRVHRIFGLDQTVERYQCNYGLNEALKERLMDGCLRISGVDQSGQVRAVELTDKRFYVATLFLPQFKSAPEFPHPLFMEFLKASLE